MAVLVPCNKPDEAPFCYGAGAGSSLVGTLRDLVFFFCHSHCATGRTFNPPGLSKSRILFTRVGAGADNKNTARRSCSASALPTCAMAVRPEANAARWPPRQLHRHGRAAARLRQPSCSPRSSTQASRRGCAAASTRRRVEEAEAAACSERGAARLKIAQRHGARTYFGWVYQKARAREGVDHSLTDTSPVQATSCL